MAVIVNILSNFLLFVSCYSKVITIQNLPSTSKYNVSFYLTDIISANEDCTSNWIDAVKIWNHQQQDWMWPTSYTHNTPYGDRYTWDCAEQSFISNCEYPLPITILLPTIHLDSMNQRHYHSMTLSNVVSNFIPNSIFHTPCDICNATDQKCTATSISIPSPDTTVSDTNVGDIMIENHPDTQEWWVAFFLEDVSLSCGEIVNVEISDNYSYKNKWVDYNETIYDKYGHFEFKWQNEEASASYTLPLSVRITMLMDETNDTQILYGYDIITTWNDSLPFDFGSNFCQNQVQETTTPLPTSSTPAVVNKLQNTTLITTETVTVSISQKEGKNEDTVKYFHGVPMDYIFWAIVASIVVFCCFICCCVIFSIRHYCKRKEINTMPRAHTIPNVKPPLPKKPTISRTLTPGKVAREFLTPSPKGYASLNEANEDQEVEIVVKGMKTIDLDGHIEGHNNEDLLNDTLREVLRLPSVPVVNDPFEATLKHNDHEIKENMNVADGSENSDEIYDNVQRMVNIQMEPIVDHMKSHDSEALYDESRVIQEAETETTVFNVEDKVNLHVIETRSDDNLPL